MGATFAALRAGRYAATTVTTTPTTAETIRLAGATTEPVPGRSSPNAPSTARSACAVPIPATTPTAEANTPVNSASTMTERVTCLRFAPIARSSAVSFVRWATVIEKVL